MIHFTPFFSKVEERARIYFEKFPFLHAILALLGILFLWHGTWGIIDFFELSFVLTTFLGFFIMIGIGLFVQTFVGNTIIIKKVEGDKQQKENVQVDLSVIQKEVSVGDDTIQNLVKMMSDRLGAIERKIDDLSKK